MKTEHIAIEDAEKMAQLTDYAWIAVEEPGSEINWADAGAFYLEGFNAGYEEGQSSPKIKQLEWKKSGGEYWEAITPIGAYSITLDFGVYVALYDMDNDVDGEWRSLAKAKAAAQRDFENKVKKCLITE